MMDIDKLEAGPELDALVAEKVMERCPHPDDDQEYWTCQQDSGFQCNKCGKSDLYHDRCPEYSTDIAPAMEVWKRVLKTDAMFCWSWDEDGRVAIEHFPQEYFGDLERGSGDWEFYGEPALVICQATLKVALAAEAKKAKPEAPK